MNNKEIFIPVLPVSPPHLEFVDGLITNDSKNILEDHINWFTNYTELYLKGLLSCETISDCYSFSREINYNLFHIKGELNID